MKTGEKSDEWLGWHFLAEDRRLRWGTLEVVEVGKTVKVDPSRLVMCSYGLHASKRAIDALEYAPGPIACRVQLLGKRLDDPDKSCASERPVLAMCDASAVLHEFACLCAEVALLLTKTHDARCWQAIEQKRAWLRGEITDKELAAARDGAWAAARNAAWAAACDGARAAAWAAARAAACDGARAAARDGAAWAAAWAAARDEENALLEPMLLEAMGIET